HDVQQISLDLGQGRRFEQLVSGTAANRRDDVPVCRGQGEPGCSEATRQVRRQARTLRMTTEGHTVRLSEHPLGFSVLEATPERLEVSFFDVDGKVIHRWSTGEPLVAGTPRV